MHVDRRYFCPLMDCAMDRGGIMSKRYSRCRSAKLGALCPPMPVFKYAMLTPGPGRQKPAEGGALEEEAAPSGARSWGRGGSSGSHLPLSKLWQVSGQWPTAPPHAIFRK